MVSPVKSDPMPHEELLIMAKPDTIVKPMPQNTVKPAENVQVDVIDSLTFLNIVSNSAQPTESRVSFKKNIKKQKFEEDEEVSKESHWFVNEEDRPLFRGPDFTTRDEDLLKLIKYMRGNFTKGDFYRYETDSQKDFDVKTLVFCTEQMKERYLIYRDVVAMCSCQSANSAEAEDRFRLSGVCFYGINNNGRNVIFGIALGKQYSSECFSDAQEH